MPLLTPPDLAPRQDAPSDALPAPQNALAISSDQLPSYTDLFGDIDRAEGLEARSVLSPAAYLVDLLQLKDGAAPDQDPDHLGHQPSQQVLVHPPTGPLSPRWSAARP